MELNILHVYPDLMNLYGEYANLAVLRRHLEALDVEAHIRTALLEDAPDFDTVDMIYMGAGTERGQKAALTALTPYAGKLKEAAGRGAVLLFTGNAMETLGASVTDADGKVWPGLGLAEYATVETKKRVATDIVASSTTVPATSVGFMNKCSITRGVVSPLFDSLSSGFGNEEDCGPEGFTLGNVFATHVTGPVLVKNPVFTDLIIQRLFALRGWDLPEKLPVLPHEQEAHDVTLEELSQNGDRQKASLE